MTTASNAILWFRDDLRLADHPALTAATDNGRQILCVYILDTSGLTRPTGDALKWWLHGSLAALRQKLETKKGFLLVLQGDPKHLIPALAEKCQANEIYCHYRYQEEARQQDHEIAGILQQAERSLIQSHGTLLRAPETITTKTGSAYKVFGAWWKAFKKSGPLPDHLPEPHKISFTVPPHLSGNLAPADEDALLLPSQPDWSGGLAETWEFGEEAAAEILADFAKGPLGDYNNGRNDMAAEGSSRLSPYLRLGIVSPRQVWQCCDSKGRTDDQETYLSELGWRDFSWYTLFHFPELPRHNLKAQFNALEWEKNTAHLKAWQRGQTGIPVVDAGMRQLWETGWMHNRARMIVASFLAKHLLIDWREGEEWFWDTLIDADPASNATNWQWVAGTGIEASPFFRIFNPLRQTEKFDPHGDYIRRWIPELAQLPDKDIAAPWGADRETLHKAGVVLGKTYPKPIIDLDEGRDRALAAYRKTKSS